MAVVFVLTAPILNPVVFLSTFVAFRDAPEMAWERMALAFAVSVIVGLALTRTPPETVLRDGPSARALRYVLAPGASSPHGHRHDDDHDHDHDYDHHGAKRWWDFLDHTADKFFDMTRFMVLGAAIAGAGQAFVAWDALATFEHLSFVSHDAMMGFSYFLSAPRARRPTLLSPPRFATRFPPACFSPSSFSDRKLYFCLAPWMTPYIGLFDRRVDRFDRFFARRRSAPGPWRLTGWPAMGRRHRRGIGAGCSAGREASGSPSPPLFFSPMPFLSRPWTLKRRANGGS